MNPVELIRKYRPSIAQVCLEASRRPIGYGSAFLVENGLVTNSHVLGQADYDTIAFRFADTDPNDLTSCIRLPAKTIRDLVKAESPENQQDYAYLELPELELEGRPRLKLADSSSLAVGEEVLFMGFPFGSVHLTCHRGHVSSIHSDGAVKVIQIDGSVNHGNSGGPLIDLKSSRVSGIITRTETGLFEKQLNALLAALKGYQDIMQKGMDSGAAVLVAGVNPMEGLQGSFSAIQVIAKNLKRSANVGIGFAYCASYVRDRIRSLRGS